MQRLLYHAPDNPNQESPFDRAIVQVVQGQNVSIVSPYIGLQYLHRLIGLSASWRLISDVLEWLSATPVRERGAVYEFLKTHYGLVHHYPAIHAKAVVSRVGAYTGSANLTDAGVLRRTEFGVLLTDPCQVSEVQQWFDDIWGQTSPPPLQSVQELIAELNQISHVAADFADLKATQLESGARRVRAKLVKILGHEPVANRFVEPDDVLGGIRHQEASPEWAGVRNFSIAQVDRLAQALQLLGGNRAGEFQPGVEGAKGDFSLTAQAFFAGGPHGREFVEARYWLGPPYGFADGMPATF